MHVKNKWTI